MLRFTDTVTTGDVINAVTLVRLSDGQNVGYTPRLVASDDRGVLLQPDQPLDPQAEYEVHIEGMSLDSGPVADNIIAFTTRALQRGPKNQVVTSADFELNRNFPSGGEQEPVMDFSTFRFQFSQPIDPATARYAMDGSVRLLDQDGQLVDAALIVDGPYMTVDPKDDYLNPGQEYTLSIDNGLASTYGEPFAGDDFDFTPKDSSPRGEPAILVQKITVPGDDGTSRLTGEPINQVPVNGTLLGENGANATQTEGDVRAELGDVTVYSDVTPIRIPRDTLLTGSNIDVMIGGEVPAGIQSGAVKMHFLSDATGYLVPNPYNSQRDDALRIVHLFMDVAISTEEAEANGGFTQDLLHIELVGVGEVDPKEGVLNLDAVSMVEPDVLGQEFAYGLLSFQLQSYPDQENPPDNTVADTTPPTLQSWTLEDLTAQGGPDKSQMAKPGDPIILNFDEPLDRESVEGNVTLYRTDNNGVLEQDIDYYMDGAALVVKPKEPLQYDEELNPTSYELQLGGGITDLTGNPFQEGFDGRFELALKVEQRQPISFGLPGSPTAAVERAPFVLGTYPGYPCLLDPATYDLAGIDREPNVGRCTGGLPAGNVNLPEDDHLPLMELPANRPIVVVFSKEIDPNSVTRGRSFRVDQINTDRSLVHENLPGTVYVHDKQLKFVPDQPWEDGALYRYVLGSNDDMTSTSGMATCDSSDDTNSAICDKYGLPLQTNMLGQVSAFDLDQPRTPYTNNLFEIHTDAVPVPTGGGADMAQYFRGAKPNDNVLQQLSTAPVSDVNGNLIHERNRVIEGTEDQSSFYWLLASFLAQFSAEEYGPTQEPDPYTISTYDPNGVRPAPNSAKIISTYKAIDNYETDFPFDPTLQSGAQYAGANVGCGYESQVVADPQPDICEKVGSTGKTCYEATSSVCPDEKFTYLASTLFGEVTNTYDPENGLKVILWPGRVMTTSFMVVQNSGIGELSSMVPMMSGYQIMRMRYSEDADGNRTQPITAWIKQDTVGNPVLNATVDLYLNAPELQQNVHTLIGPELKHNFYSYQITMELSGSVRFLPDGRMKVEQYNLTPVNIDLYGDNPITIVKFKIPQMGSFLQYVSTPIK